MGDGSVARPDRDSLFDGSVSPPTRREQGGNATRQTMTVAHRPAEFSPSRAAFAEPGNCDDDTSSAPCSKKARRREGVAERGSDEVKGRGEGKGNEEESRRGPHTNTVPRMVAATPTIPTTGIGTSQTGGQSSCSPALAFFSSPDFPVEVEDGIGTVWSKS